MKNKRIVNLRFMCCGLRFDAAIDCDWELHCYDSIEHNVTPIELYCFDKPEWDIRMMYHEERNDQQTYKECILKTCANMDAIKAEARKWVREMKRKQKHGDESR